MSTETKELIEQQVSYYRHHTVTTLLEKHPEFVIDDFTKLLMQLEKELALC